MPVRELQAPGTDRVRSITSDGNEIAATSARLAVVDPALMGEAARASTSLPGGHDEGYADTFKHLFRAFYASIESGDAEAEPSYPTFEDGHEEIVLCEAILRSQRERRWVDVGEVRDG